MEAVTFQDMSENVAAVTGAWSFSGRRVAQRLLATGWTLRPISNRSPSPETDPYNGLVRRIGYTHDVDRLATELSGCRLLVSNFWTRHDKPPIGHTGPWLSHLQAVDQSAVLIKAAARAGVERLVWTSITNAGQDPDLSYFAGKAVVEHLVRSSGLEYAILRPACFFGGGGILIDNVAWAARHLPFVPIPDGPPYRMRPIHVEDYADLVVGAATSSDNYTIDAVGPDRPDFGDLICEVAEAAGSRAKALRLPMKACRLSYAVAGRILGETVLSDDELTGLSRNRLDSNAESTGSTSILEWMRASSQELGRRFRREPSRPWH